MKHTQEQLANVLNDQYQRGVRDAKSRCTYGYSSRETLFPSRAHPDITQQAARDAYNQGWAAHRVAINQPDAVCAAVRGKGVKHSL